MNHAEDYCTLNQYGFVKYYEHFESEDVIRVNDGSVLRIVILLLIGNLVANEN